MAKRTCFPFQSMLLTKDKILQNKRANIETDGESSNMCLKPRTAWSRNCRPKGRSTVTRTLGCKGLGRPQGSSLKNWGRGVRKPTESSKHSYSQDIAKWFKKEKQSETPKKTVVQEEHVITHHLDVPGRPFRGVITHCLPALPLLE